MVGIVDGLRLDPSIHLAFSLPTVRYADGRLIVNWSPRPSTVVVESRRAARRDEREHRRAAGQPPPGPTTKRRRRSRASPPSSAAASAMVPLSTSTIRAVDRKDMTALWENSGDGRGPIDAALAALLTFPLSSDLESSLLERAAAALGDGAAEGLGRIADQVDVRILAQLAPGVLARASPSSSSLRLLRVEALECLDRRDQALEELLVAPLWSHLAIRSCHLLRMIGRPRRIIELTEGLTVLDDSTAILCIERGWAHGRLRNDSDALASWREASRLPRTPERVRIRAALERACLHVERGHLGRASSDLRRLADSDEHIEGLRNARAAITRLRS